MKNTFFLSLITGVLFFAACGSSGSEFVGRWESESAPLGIPPILIITHNDGDQFSIIMKYKGKNNQESKGLATYKDGSLDIGRQVLLSIDKRTGELVWAGTSYKKVRSADELATLDTSTEQAFLNSLQQMEKHMKPEEREQFRDIIGSFLSENYPSLTYEEKNDHKQLISLYVKHKESRFSNSKELLSALNGLDYKDILELGELAPKILEDDKRVVAATTVLEQLASAEEAIRTARDNNFGFQISDVKGIERLAPYGFRPDSNVAINIQLTRDGYVAFAGHTTQDSTISYNKHYGSFRSFGPLRATLDMPSGVTLPTTLTVFEMNTDRQATAIKICQVKAHMTAHSLALSKLTGESIPYITMGTCITLY